MTLYYYSPKAYKFVCNAFFLLHSSTIRSWVASVDCEPGFNCDVIRLIGKVTKTKPYMSDVVLIGYAMELYKGTWWDQKQRCYIGRDDYGIALLKDGDNLATEALVFMIGGVTDHWKHPKGYFLQNKISTSVQAQLIKDCIGLLHHKDLFVTALVFDGTIQRIKWQYIEALNSVQEDLDFSLANKLKKQHILWTIHKMNVRNVAQTLSLFCYKCYWLPMRANWSSWV